jgi:hypothetical protein
MPRSSTKTLWVSVCQLYASSEYKTLLKGVSGGHVHVDVIILRVFLAGVCISRVCLDSAPRPSITIAFEPRIRQQIHERRGLYCGYRDERSHSCGRARRYCSRDLSCDECAQWSLCCLEHRGRGFSRRDSRASLGDTGWGPRRDGSRRLNCSFTVCRHRCSTGYNLDFRTIGCCGGIGCGCRRQDGCRWSNNVRDYRYWWRVADVCGAEFGSVDAQIGDVGWAADFAGVSHIGGNEALIDGVAVFAAHLPPIGTVRGVSKLGIHGTIKRLA